MSEKMAEKVYTQYVAAALQGLMSRKRKKKLPTIPVLAEQAHELARELFLQHDVRFHQAQHEAAERNGHEPVSAVHE